MAPSVPFSSIDPAIRSLVMKVLIEKHEMRKIDVSTRMELAPAAITQYLQGKRGSFLAKEISQSKEAMRVVGDC
jgi:predicted transcriptional regulator